MKKIFLALLLCCVQSVFAQSDTITTSTPKSKLLKFETTINLDKSVRCRGFDFLSGNFAITYYPFKVLGAQIENRGDLMLHHRGDRYWTNSYTVGGGLHARFNVADFTKDFSEYFRIDVIATMGASYAGDFNHTYYDGRISFYSLDTCKNFGYTIGYRHYNMHNDVFGKYDFFYMGIAYKMNLF